MLKTVLRLFAFSLVVGLLASIPGCTARSITVTSNPPGADVSVNYRFIGVTPCRVGFTHYGTYRIELRKEKYEPLVREETIHTPAYGYDPISFVTDNAIPARLNDDIYLHYVMKPEGELTERAALLDRAAQAREGKITKKDGTQIVVAYTVPPKTPEQLAAQQKAAEANALPGTVNKDGTVVPGTPVIPEIKIKPIQTEEPKGPNIGKDLNIKPAEKKPDTTPPVDPNKKDTPPRTPKSEELIFEKPDAKKDAPKSDLPKAEPPKVEEKK